jgi:hypothetical protein
MDQAFDLHISGHSDQAAPIFADLAAKLETENAPRRAASVHAQAAHVYADIKDEQNALAQARAAMNLVLQYKLTHHVSTFFPNILHKMNKFGLKNATIAIEKEYGAKVAAALAPTAAPAHNGTLPTNCAKWGAPVRSDLAHWVDSQTVEGEYCDSLIRAE